VKKIAKPDFQAEL
jgi:hypothetical protein